MGPPRDSGGGGVVFGWAGAVAGRLGAAHGHRQRHQPNLVLFTNQPHRPGDHFSTGVRYLFYFGLTVALCRWWKATDRKRRERVRFIPLIAAGFWGTVLLFLWPSSDSSPMKLGVSVLVIASVAVQASSPWVGRRSGRGRLDHRDVLVTALFGTSHNAPFETRPQRCEAHANEQRFGDQHDPRWRRSGRYASRWAGCWRDSKSPRAAVGGETPTSKADKARKRTPSARHQRRDRSSRRTWSRAVPEAREPRPTA